MNGFVIGILTAKKIIISTPWNFIYIDQISNNEFLLYKRLPKCRFARANIFRIHNRAILDQRLPRKILDKRKNKVKKNNTYLY